jgi:hypothetical protein
MQNAIQKSYDVIDGLNLGLFQTLNLTIAAHLSKL